MLRILPAVLALGLALAACERSPAPAPPAGQPDSPSRSPSASAPSSAGPRAGGSAPAGVRDRAAKLQADEPAAPLCPDSGVGPEPDGPALQAFVKRRAKGIKACYGKALKRDPDLHGRVLVRFEVGTCGEIGTVRIAGPRAAAPEFTSCVAAQLRSARTPFRPREPVPVEYPLSLSAL